MPETCRLVVGDGSIPAPSWYNRAFISYLKKKGARAELDEEKEAEREILREKRGKIRFPNPLATLVIATEKEAFLILFYASLIYAGFYAVISGMPSQLASIYGFDDLKVGLMQVQLFFAPFSSLNTSASTKLTRYPLGTSLCQAALSLLPSCREK
jgi:hypothetical protein